jgi:hypothetical protein
MRKGNYPVFSTPTASFDLDAEQVENANRWAVRHHCARRGSYGTVGDKFTFNFCPTGIGDFVSMHCSCGKSVDLTGNL